MEVHHTGKIFGKTHGFFFAKWLTGGEFVINCACCLVLGLFSVAFVLGNLNCEKNME